MVLTSYVGGAQDAEVDAHAFGGLAVALELGVAGTGAQCHVDGRAGGHTQLERVLTQQPVGDIAALP